MKMRNGLLVLCVMGTFSGILAVKPSEIDAYKAHTENGYIEESLIGLLGGAPTTDAKRVKGTKIVKGSSGYTNRQKVAELAGNAVFATISMKQVDECLQAVLNARPHLSNEEILGLAPLLVAAVKK